MRLTKSELRDPGPKESCRTIPRIMPDNSASVSSKNKYWNEIIQRENRPHLYHALNNGWPDGTPYKPPPLTAPGSRTGDFYSGTWSFLQQKYDSAAGVPSALVEMARRHVPETSPRIVVGSSDGWQQTSGASPQALRTSRVLVDAARSSATPPRITTPAHRALTATPASQKSRSGRSMSSGQSC